MEIEMSKLILFKPPTSTIVIKGEAAYNIYREERIKQGWEEFLWKSLSETQQFVWHRVAQRMEKE